MVKDLSLGKVVGLEFTTNCVTTWLNRTSSDSQSNGILVGKWRVGIRTDLVDRFLNGVPIPLVRSRLSSPLSSWWKGTEGVLRTLNFLLVLSRGLEGQQKWYPLCLGVKEGKDPRTHRIRRRSIIDKFKGSRCQYRKSIERNGKLLKMMRVPYFRPNNVELSRTKGLYLIRSKIRSHKVEVWEQVVSTFFFVSRSV